MWWGVLLACAAACRIGLDIAPELQQVASLDHWRELAEAAVRRANSELRLGGITVRLQIADVQPISVAAALTAGSVLAHYAVARPNTNGSCMRVMLANRKMTEDGSQILGIAYVRVACTPQALAVVFIGTSKFFELVFFHEVMHVLGAEHSEQSSVMSPNIAFTMELGPVRIGNISACMLNHTRSLYGSAPWGAGAVYIVWMAVACIFMHWYLTKKPVLS
jgi:hypothetical protein